MSYGAHKLEQINDLANASMGTGTLLCIKYRHCKIVPLKQESQRRHIPADVILHHKPKFWAKKRVGRDNEELPLASVYGLLGRYLLGSFIHTENSEASSPSSSSTLRVLSPNYQSPSFSVLLDKLPL